MKAATARRLHAIAISSDAVKTVTMSRGNDIGPMICSKISTNCRIVLNVAT